MSWQSILVKQDVTAQVKPLNFTKKRLPLNIFNILTDNPVNIDGKHINKENVEEYIQGLLDEGKKTGVSRALERLTPIMEMEEEDFLELHYTDDDKPVPKFKYNKYKKKRQAGLPLFNKLKSMVATGRTTKRGISPVLTGAVNQIRAGNSSKLIAYLQEYTQRKKDELVNFENDLKFIKAIRESDDYEQIIALLEKVRPTLAEKAKRQEEVEYEAVANITSLDAINYFKKVLESSSGKVDKSLLNLAMPFFDAKSELSDYLVPGKPVFDFFMETESITSLPMGTIADKLGEKKLELYLGGQGFTSRGEQQRGRQSFLTEGEIPSLLDEFRASGKSFSKFKEENLDAGDKKVLDIFTEATSYYLTEDEYEDLTLGEVEGLERFKYLDKDAKEIRRIVLDNFVEIETGERVQYIIDLSGDINEVQKRIDVVKELFTTPLKTIISPLLEKLKSEKYEGKKPLVVYANWATETKPKARQNVFDFEVFLLLLISLGMVEGNRNSKIRKALAAYLKSSDDDNLDKLEKAITDEYPKLRKAFFDQLGETVQKFANLSDDDDNIKANKNLKSVRDYIRSAINNLVTST